MDDFSAYPPKSLLIQIENVVLCTYLDFYDWYLVIASMSVCKSHYAGWRIKVFCHKFTPVFQRGLLSDFGRYMYKSSPHTITQTVVGGRDDIVHFFT